ncbi:MAG: hypothetical protein WA985_09305 [Erythrobacter sp.]
MGDVVMDRTGQIAVEAAVREELVRANRELGGVAPTIAHRLQSSGQSLVSDAIVARLRGMLEHLAAQLLHLARDRSRPQRPDRESIDVLAGILAQDSAVLSHLYATAMESQLSERLEKRAALDPVLSPLLQELIGSDRRLTGELAGETLAAQSRFVQGQRRMQLAISELPAELFAGLLDEFSEASSAHEREGLARSIDALRESYDEATTRLGLLSRLLASIHEDVAATLELEDAGLALFASAIAAATQQPRDLIVLACHERQTVRLALGLRAAGQGDAAIDRQVSLLDPSDAVPAGIGAISPDRAASLLDAAYSPQRTDR